MRSSVIAVFLFGLCAGAPSLHAKERAPRPQQLMEAAHRQADPAGMIPYVLTGNVVIDPGGKREKTGRLTIYRDHDRSRVELQFGAYKEIRVSIGDRKYLPRGKHDLTVMGLGDLDRNWDPGLPPGNSSKPAYNFGKVKKTTVDGHHAWCFDEKSKSGKNQLCFDTERSLLISEYFGLKRRRESFDYGPNEQPAFPRLVKIRTEGAHPLEVRGISVSSGSFDEKLFSKPPDAIEIETCKGMQPPKLLSMPLPSFPQLVHRSETVRVHAIITRDGRVEAVQVLNHEHDAYAEEAKSTLARWKFKPATCSGRPVNMEKEFVMSFQR